MRMRPQEREDTPGHEAMNHRGRPPLLMMVMMPLTFIAPLFAILSVYRRLGRIERLLEERVIQPNNDRDGQDVARMTPGE
jgi:hypothetical protein